jgi:hypothetical protein
LIPCPVSLRYLGENWPRECLPVVKAIEDTWIRTKLNFKQENPVPTSPPLKYEGNDIIRVVISVQWGWLNVFDSVWRCHTPECRNGSFANPSCSGTFLVDGDVFGHTTDAPDCNTTCAGLGNPNCKVEWIRYGYQAKTSKSPPKRTLTFQGNYDAVYLALQNVTYRPDPYQNSLRLRSRYYSPIQAQLGPYEKLIARIFIGADLVASLTTMVIIDYINNPPTLTNPQEGYKRPPVCDVDPLTTFPACHFGQFYRMENTDKILAIPNVQATDIDIFENCNYAVPECSKVPRPYCSAPSLARSPPSLRCPQPRRQHPRNISSLAPFSRVSVAFTFRLWRFPLYSSSAPFSFFSSFLNRAAHLSFLCFPVPLSDRRPSVRPFLPRPPLPNPTPSSGVRARLSLCARTGIGHWACKFRAQRQKFMFGGCGGKFWWRAGDARELCGY